MKFSKTIAAITALFAAMLPVCALAATYNYVGTMGLWSCHDYDITNAVNWSSGEMPNATNDYVVSGSDSAKRFCAVGVNGSFPGNSLKISGLDGNAHLGLMKSRTYTFPNDGLILNMGRVWVHSGVSFTINGRVTVGNAGSTWRGVYLYGYNTAKSLTFTGSFTSASDSISSTISGRQ